MIYVSFLTRMAAGNIKFFTVKKRKGDVPTIC